MSAPDYIDRKIVHLKRVGLVAGGKTGYGKNGGACPDWLVAEQKAEEKRLEEVALRAFERRVRAD